ncbi:MAG: hypothetical protein L3J32_05625 [Rhizobiaceae bacterium]|nr:hypothetical protein [Rhizobiaceae bacterium]
MTVTAIRKFNRRKFLSSSAVGALAVAGLAGVGSNKVFAGLLSGDAKSYWSEAKTQRYLCSQIHLSKSQELSRIVASPNLDIAEKNLALRTTRCPSCAVQIRPGGEGAGYAIGV